MTSGGNWEDNISILKPLEYLLFLSEKQVCFSLFSWRNT